MEQQSPFDLNTQNKNVDSRIVAAFERIGQAFKTLLWNESKQHALSPIQIQILIFLLNHDPNKRTVSYLATEFNMTKPTISDAVKTLEQKDFVEKDYSPSDGRSYTIHLSPSGQGLAVQTSAFAQALLQPIERLDGMAKDSLLDSLFKIIDHLHDMEIISVQRMCLTCAHYESTQEAPGHFCTLLRKKLKATELRLDCPEHVNPI